MLPNFSWFWVVPALSGAAMVEVGIVGKWGTVESLLSFVTILVVFTQQGQIAQLQRLRQVG